MPFTLDFFFFPFILLHLVLQSRTTIINGVCAIDFCGGDEESQSVDPPAYPSIIRVVTHSCDALVQGGLAADAGKGQRVTPLTVFSPHAGPSGAFSPDGNVGYMMDSQAMVQMHRPPGDPAYHNQYAHYPAEYYGHHL